MAQVLSRSSIEAYLATVIGVVVWELPVTALWKSVGLLIPLALVIDIVWRSPWTITIKPRLKVSAILALVVVYGFVVGVFVIQQRRERESDLKISVAPRSVIMAESIEGKESSTLHLFVTVRNKGASTTIPPDSWILFITLQDKKSISVNASSAESDLTVQEGDKRVVEPVQSQDFLNKIEAVTSVHPVVGVLSFHLPEVRYTNLFHSDGQLSCHDANGKEYVVSGLQIGYKETVVGHLPGFNERVIPDATSTPR